MPTDFKLMVPYGNFLVAVAVRTLDLFSVRHPLNSSSVLVGNSVCGTALITFSQHLALTTRDTFTNRILALHAFQSSELPKVTLKTGEERT